MPTLASHLLAFAGGAVAGHGTRSGDRGAVAADHQARPRSGFRHRGRHRSRVFFWAAMAALGLTAVLAASEMAYTGLRIAGAITLIVLGVQAISRYLTLTTAIHAARSWFRRGSLRRRLERWSGVSRIGFGLRLAAESR